MSEPKTAVIGIGPVGGVVGAYLAGAGHYTVLCDIQRPHLEAIEAKGLSLSGVAELTAPCSRLAEGVSELAGFPQVDTIVIATKASVLPRIVPRIAEIAKPGTRFVICQNGLDNEDYLAKTVGAENVLRIVVNYGGSQMGDGHILMSFFNPPNYIGAMASQGEPLARQMAEMLTDAGLETKFTDDIKKYEWEKVILNAALSAVCALTRKPMKDMMDFETTERLVRELLREGIEVAQACGIKIEGFFEYGMEYLRKAGYHRTSMHQDVLRGLPTEIDWLNGKIVERGAEIGLLTPYNTTITALIKGLEIKSKASKDH